MKVAFFLDNKAYADVDFSRPEEGNPGIRGTQYMIWTVACMLSRWYEDIDILLLAPVISRMPTWITSIQCEDECRALRISKELAVDIIVIRTRVNDKSLFRLIDEIGIPCITWAHNFENYELIQEIANTKAIVRHVCVGKQQYDRLRDHEVFSKSTYIYNCLDFDKIQRIPRIEPQQKEDIVLYVGALNKLKGFHKLAKAWKGIIRKNPNAKLYVIGTGDLGDSNTLGEYGLAVQSYEKRFIKYVTDKKGEFLDSVCFLGNIGGEEKYRYITTAKVGVANPTGIGETFCIVAIEFEALGVPVVSARRNGLLDTVDGNIDGILVKTTAGLRKAVLQMLDDNEENERMGNAGYEISRTKFGIGKIVDEWHSLILDVFNNAKCIPDLSFNHPFNQMKWARELNRRIKTTRVGRKLPSLLYYRALCKSILKRILH